ncbi:MAG: hypothetical protein K6T64_12315 [Kyrpidia sp.]|nr:hypothetical protein [Kyrpidia sp.]
MRKSIDGLAALVQGVFRVGPVLPLSNRLPETGQAENPVVKTKINFLEKINRKFPSSTVGGCHVGLDTRPPRGAARAQQNPFIPVFFLRLPVGTILPFSSL